MATRKAKPLTDKAQYLRSQLATWAERRLNGGYDQADVHAALIAAAADAKAKQP